MLRLFLDRYYEKLRFTIKGVAHYTKNTFIVAAITKSVSWLF